MGVVRAYTDRELLNRARSPSNFKGFPRGYWILGVRAKNPDPNKFNCKFYLFHEEKFAGVVTTGTTIPGSPVLMGGFKKYNKDGAFVVKSNVWHYDIWKGGLHKGVLKALRQRIPIMGYRDGNCNGIAEEIGTVYVGMFGINFHLNAKSFLAKFVGTLVGWWSAGCQVPNQPDKYRAIIDKCYNQPSTSYCLIRED